MPNRIIKESICTSDSVDQMTWFEECFWHRLIVNCDDYGRFDARISVLKARLFPLKEKVQGKDIETAIAKLVSTGCVVLYEYAGKPYLYLPSWENHQTIRAKKSRYPSPGDQDSAREIICTQTHADEIGCSRNPIQSESYSESESNANNADKPRRFTKPTVEEVAEYCRERGNRINAQSFIDFYESKGWKVGNSPMKDWKAAIRTWEQRDKEKNPPQKEVNNADRYAITEGFKTSF
ncbi:MAG: hypothetical protein EOM37_12280 [Proteobacteria bacterium]|nr:hypothetical protein [Pseudomonadota bacterium]